MVNINPIAGPGDIEFANQTVDITCTDALAKGDLVMLTLASGGFAACTKSATADSTPDHILGVSAGVVTAGKVGTIILKGVCQVSRHDTGAAGLAVICGGAAGRVTAAATDPATDASAYTKIVGIALTTAAGSPTAGELATVLFDGVNGFSQATA